MHLIVWLHSKSYIRSEFSCDENAGTTGLLDSLLGGLGEKLGLDDDWDLWHDTLSENLEVALFHKKLIKFSYLYLIINWEEPLSLKGVLTDLVTSITGALSLALEAAFLVASETRDQSLSVLTDGQNLWFLCIWKVLIPHLPKCPSWLKNTTILDGGVEYLLFVHHDSFMVHASCKTSTTWTLSMLADSSVSHWNVTSHMSNLLQSCDLIIELC